jgi:hypothetical protein
MMLQFEVLLTDDAGSVNYNHNMFIIQATDLSKLLTLWLPSLGHTTLTGLAP